MSYAALRRGRVSVSQQIYLLTAVTLQRQPLFIDLVTGRIVVRALRAQDHAAHTRTLAFVVMPDHFHWLMQLTGTRDLRTVMRGVKGTTAYEINRRLLRRGKVWQPSFHDHALRKEENLPSVARYVVHNPLRAGLVGTLREYSLWDAMWIGESG